MQWRPPSSGLCRARSEAAPPCADPEDTGFWLEGSTAGLLLTGSPGNCCNIDNSGPDWSSAIPLPYPEPNPIQWSIPDPPGVMLP